MMNPWGSGVGVFFGILLYVWLQVFRKLILTDSDATGGTVGVYACLPLSVLLKEYDKESDLYLELNFWEAGGNFD